jgi:competence protein ComEC
MLLVSPLLVFNAGFWLSISATAGLLLIGPRLSAKLKSAHYPFIQSLAGSLTETLSAYLASLPFVIIFFHQATLLSVVANLLVIGLIPLIMAWGGLIAIVYPIFPWLGEPLSWFIYPVLRYLVLVITFFGQNIKVVFAVNLPIYFVIFICILYYLLLYRLLKFRGLK